MSQVAVGQFGADFATFVATNLDPHFEPIHTRVRGAPAQGRVFSLFDPSKLPTIETFFFQTKSQALEELSEEMGERYPKWADREKILQRSYNRFRDWMAHNEDVVDVLSPTHIQGSPGEVAQKLEKLRKVIVDDAFESEIVYNETYLNSDLPYEYVRDLVRAEYLIDSEFDLIVQEINNLVTRSYLTQNEIRIRREGQFLRTRVGKMARSALDVSKLSAKLRTYPDLCNSDSLDTFTEFKRIQFAKLDKRLFTFHIREMGVAMSDLQSALVEFDPNFGLHFPLDEPMKILKTGIASLLLNK